MLAELGSGLLVNIVVGSVGGMLIGLVVGILIAVLKPPKPCPVCGEKLPRLRNCFNVPKVIRRCTKCKTGFDAQGNKVA